MPTLMSDCGAAELDSAVLSVSLAVPSLSLSLPHAPRARTLAAIRAANFVVRRKTPPYGCCECPHGRWNRATVGPRICTGSTVTKLLQSRCVQCVGCHMGEHLRAHGDGAVVDAQVALVQ